MQGPKGVRRQVQETVRGPVELTWCMTSVTWDWSQAGKEAWMLSSGVTPLPRSLEGLIRERGVDRQVF